MKIISFITFCNPIFTIGKIRARLTFFHQYNMITIMCITKIPSRFSPNQTIYYHINRHHNYYPDRQYPPQISPIIIFFLIFLFFCQIFIKKHSITTNRTKSMWLILYTISFPKSMIKWLILPTIKRLLGCWLFLGTFLLNFKQRRIARVWSLFYEALVVRWGVLWISVAIGWYERLLGVGAAYWLRFIHLFSDVLLIGGRWFGEDRLFYDVVAGEVFLL